jgi:hypothetical protein
MLSEIITVYVEHNAETTQYSVGKVWSLLMLAQMVHIFTIGFQSVNKHKF